MRKLPLSLLLSVSAFAQVAFNNTNTPYSVNSGSMSHAFSVTAGQSNLAAFAWVQWNWTSGGTITSITYGGQAMTAIGTTFTITHNGNPCYSNVFYLVNPPTGSNTLAIAGSSVNQIEANLVSFYGVNQTTPIRSGTIATANTGNNSSYSLTVSSNANDLTFSYALVEGNSVTGTNQTSDGISSDGTIGSDHGTTRAASLTHIWSFSGTNSDQGFIGFSIMAAAAPALTLSGCPSGGIVRVASTSCTVNIGTSFDGSHSVTIADGSQGGTITPGVGSPGTGSVTVTPTNGATSFTFAYTPAAVGSLSLSFTNTGSWISPNPLAYTSTPPALSVSGCTNPGTGNYGTASSACTVSVSSGSAFDGVGSVTIADSNSIMPGTFTPSVGSPGVGSVTVTPANGATSFTVAYTPATVGTRAFTFTNSFSPSWANPTWSYTGTSAQPCTFTMTGSGTQSITAASGWTSTGSCGHSAPTTGDALVATASGGSLTITVPNDSAIHPLGTCPSANTTYDLQLTAVAAGSAVFDVQPGAKFYFCGNKLLTSVATSAGSTPTVWADLRYETGATVYEDEAQASYAHRTISGADNEWARLLWGASTDTCTYGPGTAYSCPTNVLPINAGSVNPVLYAPNGTHDSHLFKVYGTAIKNCGSASVGCIAYLTNGLSSTAVYADAGALYFGGDVFDTTGGIQAPLNGWLNVGRVNVAGSHFVNDLAGFASLNIPESTLQSCTIAGNYFSGNAGNNNLLFPSCYITGNVFADALQLASSLTYTLGAFTGNVEFLNQAAGQCCGGIDRVFTAPILSNYVANITNASSNHGIELAANNLSFRNNFFETLFTGSGEGHFSGSGGWTSASTVKFLDNLSIPAANGSNSGQIYGWANQAPTTCESGWFDHNGAYGRGVYSWLVFLGHPTGDYCSNQVLRSLRSNIGWSSAANANNLAVANQGDPSIASAPANNVYVPGESNNAWYNPAASASYGAGVNANCNPSTSMGTPYDQCTASGTPGAHDIVANPKLVDPTRGLFKWASVMQGQAASLAGAEAAFLGCQNLGYCIAQLETWVKAGYQPTNLALKGKAHDGGVVGVAGTLGSGYSGACSASVTVQDTDDLGTGAALSCSFVGGVPSIQVVNPGMHYRVATPATVTITGTGGSGTSLNVVVSPSDIGPVPITLFASVAP